MKNLVTVISGVLFGIGMTLSGMINPNNVIGFLDITGEWNPSLIFVMGGALMVFMPIYHLKIKPMSTPILSPNFNINQYCQVDKPLVIGASIFGLGWGLAGICPGPALTALAGLNFDALLFVIFMLLGMSVASPKRLSRDH
ncbi:YeeE/YedE family protein [Parashewanella spongiae]|uniref:YeeE/YedE family protein n=1 Tax=Parashewanella spongiae TaxID=342950 RepID=A0A3A6TAS3_9GAMM|nr:YeeE/YedE family protein [Parashewanella spongiae]MCL1080194.1 YeeE/YedE family protein [Parashewanella spongiae]RJY02188.1 YeeE/YedE family protein [Parashewanella spongiae]